MSEQAKNGTALQILQTILVAVLLGATGWLANAVIQNREESVRLRTQFDERKKIADDMLMVQAEVVKVQQEILRKLIEMQDTTKADEARLGLLERKSP